MSGPPTLTAMPIKRARARSTGTLVEVWRSDDFGDEQSAPYVTVCEHGSICEHDTRAMALSWSAAPEEWCETGCRHSAYQRARCSTCLGQLNWAEDAWICSRCGDEFACPCDDCSTSVAASVVSR